MTARTVVSVPHRLPLLGMACAAVGYACLGTQDAIVKWLLTHYGLPEILFFRSVFIVVLTVGMSLVRRSPSILQSANKPALLIRASLTLIAWLCFYSAARQLQLAEMMTIYFSGPIIVVVLSIVILKEKVGAAQWLAVLICFAGVLVAVDPGHRTDLIPAALVLVAALCWGLGGVLVRKTSHTETSLNQMLAGNLLFLVASAIMLPVVWVTPNSADFALLFFLGMVGGCGQFMLYEGFRFAPASIVAPVEYSLLLWATLYGFLIWGDIPLPQVLVGASLIIASGLWMVWRQTGLKAEAA